MRIEFKILAICLVLSQMALGFNLGSYARAENVKISRGSAVFEILVWTSESYDIGIILFAESKPPGWDVRIEPSKFSINSTTGGEIVLSGSNARMAQLVKVTATPGSYSAGDYEIKIVAEAGLPSSGISSVQQRTFNLHVNVISATSSLQSGNFSILSNMLEIIKKLSGASESQQGSSAGASSYPTTTMLQGNAQAAGSQPAQEPAQSSGPTGMAISGSAADYVTLFIFAISIIILLACAIKLIKRARE